MADEGTSGQQPPVGPPTAGPPTAWPGAPAPGATPAPDAAPPVPRRPRWPFVAGAVAVAAVAAVGVVVVVDGGGSDEPYCATLDLRARPDVPLVAFLDPGATDADTARVEEIIAGLDATDVDHVDQAEAYEEAQEMFADAPDTAELLRPEDVPSSFRFAVPDGPPAVEAQREVGADDAVISVERPTITDGRTVLEVISLVTDDELEGELGRFGHWIDPDVAERLAGAAPGDVEPDVAIVAEALSSATPAVETRTRRAAEAIVRDAEVRCDGD